MGELDLKLKKGGKLWYFSHNREEGEGGWKDVTSNAFRHLFDACDLEEDITLRDIFLLARKNMWVLELVIGNWIKEIVSEGLDNESKTEFIENPRHVEYLELYWHIFQETNDYNEGKVEKRFYGLEFPDFGGVGYIVKEEYTEDGSGFKHEVGSREHFAVEFSPTPELIDLPVKLKRECEIYDQDYTKPVETRFSSSGYPVIHKADGAAFSLGAILYGIFYELSFCGNPEMRDAEKNKLDQIIADVKSGKEKMIPWEDVKKKLGIDED